MEMKQSKPFNKRILIIDDNQDILETYKDILSPTLESIDQLRSSAGKTDEPLRESFDLILASQGQEGFECVKKALEKDKPFAATFIDMRMPPGWDGLETAQKIRELDNRIYINIVTGYTDYAVDDIYEAVRHNLLFVRKPFTEEEIYQLARNLCQSWQRDYELEEYQNKLEKMVADRTVKFEREITVRKQVEVELIKAKEEAEKSNSVKSLFLLNMSHEIRIPLNLILGFTDIIKDSVDHLLGEEEKGFFDILKSSGERLYRTIHGILDISQIEAGTLKFNLKRLRLHDLVEKIIKELLPEAQSKGLELTYISKVINSTIIADEQSLVSAVSNLVDNAIKYTVQGKIEVSLNKNDKELILTINDTGIGMAEDYLDQMFNSFSQESTGHTRKYQGLGLGLAIAKRYLEVNNVGIEVQSVKGIGTTFTLTFKTIAKLLPQENTEIEDKLATEVEKIISKRKPIVLVVEDDPNSQMLMEYYLKKGYKTYFAVSVSEAKQQLKKHPFDLILQDLSLVGDEDGLDLTRYLRKTKNWKNIPIIALTAHAFTEDRDNCIAAGCNDYLTKPIKREELLKKISEFV